MTAYPPSSRQTRPPAPLVVAASLVVVEAILLVLYGLAEIVAVAGSRLVMGVTTSIFFVVYGVGLAYCAWALTRLRSWARAPLVLAQLIQLLVSWSFLGGRTTPIAVGLIGCAAVVLIGILHPASLSALADDEPGST